MSNEYQLKSKLLCFACTIAGNEEVEDRYGLCPYCKGLSTNEINLLRLITMQVVPNFLNCYISEIKAGKLRNRMNQLIEKYQQYELGEIKR